MPLKKTIVDADFQEITLTKYKKAKYIKIKISHQGQVSLSLPYYVSFSDALNFVQEKRAWIQEQINKIKIDHAQIKFLNPNSYIEIPETNKLENISEPILVNFQSKHHELMLIPCELSKISSRISANKIKIYYPNTLSSKDPEIITEIKNAINKALKKEAKNFLPQRVAELAQKHQLKYKSLTLRNTKSRWGSCTYDNKINLCIQLMRLPNELIDYVILHELTHTLEKNHSANFWHQLSLFLGKNSKAIDKKLKAYKTELLVS